MSKLRGTISGWESHGTIVQVWVKPDLEGQAEFPVNFDHRMFMYFHDGEQGDIKGRAVKYDSDKQLIWLEPEEEEE